MFELFGGYIHEVCGECDCSEYVHEELFCGCISFGGETIVRQCGCAVGYEYLWVLCVGISAGAVHILEVWEEFEGEECVESGEHWKGVEWTGVSRTQPLDSTTLFAFSYHFI